MKGNNRLLGINVETKERVSRITVDRPPLNVLDIPLLRELDATLASCAQESQTDVLVIQGAGQRAFSAGVDIRDHTRENVPEMLDVVHGVIRKLFTVPQLAAISCSRRRIASLRLLRFMSAAIRRWRLRVFLPL